MEVFILKMTQQKSFADLKSHSEQPFTVLFMRCIQTVSWYTDARYIESLWHQPGGTDMMIEGEFYFKNTSIFFFDFNWNMFWWINTDFMARFLVSAKLFLL